jgi:hypothetical protein
MQHPAAQNDDAECDGPADSQKLSEGAPREGRHRTGAGQAMPPLMRFDLLHPLLGTSVPVAAPRIPSAKADQCKNCRNCACEGGNPKCGVVTPPKHGWQQQDRHKENGVRPRRCEPGPYQAGADCREPGEHNIGGLAKYVRPVESCRQTVAAVANMRASISKSAPSDTPQGGATAFGRDSVPPLQT